MSDPIHPLVRPHVDALSGLPEPSGSAGFEEIERRVEELILEWLKHYFSGAPFDTPMPGGGVVSKSLQSAQVFMGRSYPSDQVVAPVIHTFIADRKDDDGRLNSGGSAVVTGSWIMNTFIRVPAQAPADPSAPSSSVSPATLASHHAARRIASQFAWLLRSPHSRDLVMKGVGDPRVVSGPRAIQSGSWDVYQITWSVKIFHTVSA